jgi:Carboxypeptidase regulatory-like domain
MNRIIIALLAVLCLSSIHLQAAHADDATTGTITGTVVDDAGNPANDCIIVATPIGDFMHSALGDTATDAKGKFTIKDVPEGNFSIKARTRDGRLLGVKDVTVTAGQNTDAGTIKLKPKKAAGK